MKPVDWGTITEEEIGRRIQLIPDEDPPILAGFRRAAVLVPILWEKDGWHLLFTRRTETVQSHKGQVAFPGGVSEPGDTSPEGTALREAYEEIGLEPQSVRILGRMGHLITVSNYLVTPVLGRIEWPYLFQISPEEVSRVFTIPLSWLADDHNREEKPRILPTGAVENVVYFQPYDSETLWGISARITVELLDGLSLSGSG